LVHFGARDYDPQTGSWLSKDPLRFKGGDTNFYTYAQNDPINKVDPTGRDWAIGIGVQVSVVLGGIGGSWGVNLEYTQSAGLGLYGFYTPSPLKNNANDGFTVGASCEANIAFADRDTPWSGDFEQIMVGAGPFGGSVFWSPGYMQGAPEAWSGVSLGGSVGFPIGLASTSTNYVPLIGGK
jgi:hypothetical protein